jgi:DNA polymerase IV (DinB-like DNA polymerase)
MRDNPDYQGKPVIIGADPKEGKGRGVVSTCSYEARKFGLHSAMPISQAYRNCPHGIYLKPNFEKYNKASEKVMNIIKSGAPKFQQVGIDEAYIDITEICPDYNRTLNFAQNLQKKIFKEVGITISIGCAPTKSLAKIASDLEKPHGITILTRNNFKNVIQELEISKIPGIGRKSKIYLYKKGIKKIRDIINSPKNRMIELFGKQGKRVWEIANGLDEREVKEFPEDRKSISKERTFYEDTNNFNEIFSKFEEMNQKIHKKIINKNIYYRTITLKIRFEGFITYTRSKTLPYPIQNKAEVMRLILDLYDEFSNSDKKVRLVGIKLSNFNKDMKKKQTKILKYATI